MCDGSLDRSLMVNPLSYVSFTTGLTKAVECTVLSDPFMERVAHEVAAVGVLSRYISPYVRRHITVNKMC